MKIGLSPIRVITLATTFFVAGFIFGFKTGYSSALFTVMEDTKKAECYLDEMGRMLHLESGVLYRGCDNVIQYREDPPTDMVGEEAR